MLIDSWLSYCEVMEIFIWYFYLILDCQTELFVWLCLTGIKYSKDKKRVTKLYFIFTFVFFFKIFISSASSDNAAQKAGICREWKTNLLDFSILYIIACVLNQCHTGRNFQISFHALSFLNDEVWYRLLYKDVDRASVRYGRMAFNFFIDNNSKLLVHFWGTKLSIP